MTKDYREIEAAKAMVLLSKDETKNGSEKENIAFLKYPDKIVYIDGHTYEVNENNKIIKFTYFAPKKSWKLSCIQGDCMVNKVCLKKDDCINIIDRSLIILDSTYFSFFYGGSYKRPQKSYQKLIIEAIESSKDKKLTLSQIYLYFKEYAGFEELDSTTWKNSIRHNLSLSKIFVKTHRTKLDPPGKGSFWSINSNFSENNSSPPETFSSSQTIFNDKKSDYDDVKGNTSIYKNNNKFKYAINGIELNKKDIKNDKNQSEVAIDKVQISKQEKNIDYASVNRKRKHSIDGSYKKAKYAFLMQNRTIAEAIERETLEQIKNLRKETDEIIFIDTKSAKKRSMSVAELSEEFESLYLNKKDRSRYNHKK